MYRITEWNLIAESSQAVQVQIVNRRDMRYRNVWLPRSQIKFTGRELIVPIWLLSSKNITPC